MGRGIAAHRRSSRLLRATPILPGLPSRTRSLSAAALLARGQAGAFLRCCDPFAGTRATLRVVKTRYGGVRLRSASHIRAGQRVASFCIEAFLGSAAWEELRERGRFAVPAGSGRFGLIAAANIDDFGGLIDAPDKGLAANCELRYRPGALRGFFYAKRRGIRRHTDLAVAYGSASLRSVCIETAAAAPAPAPPPPSVPHHRQRCANCSANVPWRNRNRHAVICRLNIARSS